MRAGLDAEQFRAELLRPAARMQPHEGLARRSPQSWIARASASPPVPASPSISTGTPERAALSARRMNRLAGRRARRRRRRPRISSDDEMGQGHVVTPESMLDERRDAGREG